MTIWFIIGAFAVFRMTTDLASARALEGPFNIYENIRDHVAFRNYPEWIKEGVNCPWCVSFWFGCCFGVCYPIAGLCSWWMYPVVAAGLSGPTVAIYSVVELFTDGVASDV